MSYAEEKGGMKGEEGECQNGKRKGRDKTGDDAREGRREEDKEEIQTAEQPLLQIITSCHSNGG